MDKNNINVLIKAISKQIYSLFGNHTQGSYKAREGVLLLLDNHSDFNIPSEFIFDSVYTATSHLNEIQDTLSNLNEKEIRRKKDGVFYTLPDVTNFITSNAFLKFSVRYETVMDTSEALIKLSGIDSFQIQKLLDATIFDPTCGAGEFLISAISIKLDLAKGIIDDSIILRIADSIYGNDIVDDSIYITKIRVFFALLPHIKEVENILELAKRINTNFTITDFINADLKIFNSFDIILGNPPYIEYRVLDFVPNEQFGNTYANVLNNSAKLVKSNGVIGFIVPISFVATKRMYKIRENLDRTFSNICVLNYADRPDCLFSGVHQKLTIVFASNITTKKTIYSSSYNYWYKHERPSLFKRCSLVPVTPDLRLGIPKLGNEIESSIFLKCLSEIFELNLYDASISVPPTKNNSVYLNMRNCFWIKAFSFNPGSSEYKRFAYSSKNIDFVRCILNSSLFFFFWVVVSDCWHITSKELSMFKLPQISGDVSVFSSLFAELEKKLEDTKVYVGTKQTEYEYKHRLCKDVIDKIDEAIATSFELTSEEVDYLKSFILKYRLSDGA